MQGIQGLLGLDRGPKKLIFNLTEDRSLAESPPSKLYYTRVTTQRRYILTIHLSDIMKLNLKNPDNPQK